MKKQYKFLCVASLMTLAFSLTGCNNKRPEEGYLSDAQVLGIIDKFNNVDDNQYTQYNVKGKINYYNLPEDVVERNVDKNRPFEFANDAYNPSSASYYLALPLNITLESWNADIHEDPKIVTFNSTKYNLEARLITISDEYKYGVVDCYYYAREGGGFILKTFCQNKKLQIKNPTRLDSNAKWNITIEYNAEGYLVKEKFETINAHKDDDSETCYGEATYEYL